MSCLIEFITPEIDEKALSLALRRQFAATDLKVTISPLQGASLGAPRVKRMDQGLPSRIRAFLEGAGTLHVSQIIAAMAPATPTYVSAVLGEMVHQGLLDRVRWGYYRLPGGDAGCDTAAEETLGVEGLSPALRAAYDLLATPMSAVAVRDALGGTRQAVEQKLARLRQLKLVERTSTAGERSPFVYFHAERKPVQVMAQRPPDIRDNAARVLSALPVSGLVAAGVLRGMAGLFPTAFASAVRTLQRNGLIETLGRKNLAYVALSPSGAAHPRYDQGGPKAIATPPQEIFRGVRLQVILLLWTLGEARSLDLTLLTGFGRWGRDGGGMGQILARLEDAEIVEEVPGDGHRPYRLAARGRKFVSLLHGLVDFPDAHDVATRLTAARADFRQAARHRAMGGETPTGRPAEVLEVLRSRGAMRPMEIQSFMANPYYNSQSLYTALRDLAKQGLVRKTPEGQWEAGEVASP